MGASDGLGDERQVREGPSLVATRRRPARLTIIPAATPVASTLSEGLAPIATASVFARHAKIFLVTHSYPSHEGAAMGCVPLRLPAEQERELEERRIRRSAPGASSHFN